MFISLFNSTFKIFTCFSLSCIQEMKIPTKVFSASLHPNKSVFVCGGEDLIMYKYDYLSGIELGIIYFLLLHDSNCWKILSSPIILSTVECRYDGQFEAVNFFLILNTLYLLYVLWECQTFWFCHTCLWWQTLLLHLMLRIP